MKKLIILLFLTFLFSCGKEEIKIMTESKTNTGVLVKTGITNNTGSELKINTQTGNIVNTGSEEPKKEVVVKTIKKEGFNLFLYENDKKIDSLTTYGNTNKIDTLTCGNNGGELISYDVLEQDKNYGIIKKEIYKCGTDAGSYDIFAMSFNSGKNELTNISKNLNIPTDVAEPLTYIDGVIKIKVLGDNVIDGEPERFMITVNELKKSGFIKDGKDWVKIVELDKIFSIESNEIKKEEIIKNTDIKTKELVNKETKNQEVKKQDENIPKVGDYKQKGDGRNYTKITISNLKNNSFDFRVLSNFQAEIEDNDKIMDGIGTGKKEGNKWKIYVNDENGNDMSECSADADFLPEGVKISNINSCEILSQGLYK